MEQKYILLTLVLVALFGAPIVLKWSRSSGKTWAESTTRSIYVLGVVLAIGEIIFLGPLLFKSTEDGADAMAAIFLPIITLVATVVAGMIVGMFVSILEGTVKPDQSGRR